MPVRVASRIGNSGAVGAFDSDGGLEKLPSGLKPALHLGVMARLKPCPFKAEIALPCRRASLCESGSDAKQHRITDTLTERNGSPMFCLKKRAGKELRP